MFECIPPTSVAALFFFHKFCDSYVSKKKTSTFNFLEDDMIYIE